MIKIIVIGHVLLKLL